MRGTYNSPATFFHVMLVTFENSSDQIVPAHKIRPWNRSRDGRFHKPDEVRRDTPSSPTMSATDPPKNERPVVRRSQMGDSFRNYIDTLDLNFYEM